MATRTSFLAPDNVSDALFRLWINEMHDSLIAFGWLQTSDTGQINFATVTRPTAINTYPGYAIYKMNDSLQATCAVYMRIDYGTGGATDGPGIKLQVCIGSTNGAGTLTGNVMVAVSLAGNAAGVVTQYNCRTSGSTSSFRMHFWSTNIANTGWTFAVERDQTTAGADSSLGVNIITMISSGNGNGMTSQFLELAGGAGTVDALWYAMVSASTTQAGQGAAGVGPVRTQLGPFRNPMKSMLVYARADYISESTNPVTIYGTTRTYLMLRPQPTITRSINTWNADCGMALLWE